MKPRWLVVVLTLGAVLATGCASHKESRAEQGDAPRTVQDELVEKVGLTQRQATKVVKVHERYAANLEKVDKKYQREADKIRKAETQQLARIVGEDKVAKVERVFEPPWWRQLPFGNRGIGNGGRSSDSPASGLDIRGLKEWVRDPRDLTPQQKLKLRDLMKSYQEQLEAMQAVLREKLNQILASEQLERFRSGTDEGEEP